MFRFVGQKEVAKIIGGPGDSCKSLSKNQHAYQKSGVNQAGTGHPDYH